MHDFRCTDARDMYDPLLAETVAYYKETEGGHDVLCKIMEDLWRDAEKERSEDIARDMIRLGNMSYETIAELTRLTEEDVKRLAELQPA